MTATEYIESVRRANPALFAGKRLLIAPSSLEALLETTWRAGEAATMARLRSAAGKVECPEFFKELFPGV